jgi:hypothetical protein
MGNSFIPENGQEADSNWSPEGVLGQEESVLPESGFWGWWHRLTVAERPAARASYAQRETHRRAILFSTISFFLLILLIAFLPATLFMPPHVIYLDSALIVCDIIALFFLNKAGRTNIASVFLIASAEVVLSGVIIFIRPLDATVIQLYDLFIIIELLAVSFLPVTSIFFLAGLHSVFISVDLILQNKTADIALLVNTQLLPMLIRPIGLQFMVAGVVFLWVRSATQATARAKRVEMIARMEHRMAVQRQEATQEKQELEESIQQLVKAHVDVSQGQLVGRVAYPPAKVLWPLVGVLNSLWTRLQRSQQHERELQQLKQAIVSSAEYIQGMAGPGQLPHIPRTGTDLDQVFLSVKTLAEKRTDRSGPNSGWGM